MKTETHISPAFAYPGGKTRLLKYILPLIPPHKTYCEPFAGGLAVLLAKPRSTCEVVNDFDAELVNFYRQVRCHYTALFTELQGAFSINSRDDFVAYRDTPGITELQRAARWYYLRVCSFGAKATTWGRKNKNKNGWDPRVHEKRIRDLAIRLQGVQIDRADFAKVLEFYDQPQSFSFIDPPYVECCKSSYSPFTADEMRRVRAAVENLKGSYLLTVDNSPICREIFAGLPSRTLSICYSISGLSSKPATELLIASPSIAAAHPGFTPIA